MFLKALPLPEKKRISMYVWITNSLYKDTFLRSSCFYQLLSTGNCIGALHLISGPTIALDRYGFKQTIAFHYLHELITCLYPLVHLQSIT